MGAVGGGRRLLANRRKKQTGAAVASQVTGMKKGAPVKTGSQPRVQPQLTLDLLLLLLLLVVEGEDH